MCNFKIGKIILCKYTIIYKIMYNYTCQRVSCCQKFYIYNDIKMKKVKVKNMIKFVKRLKINLYYQKMQ